MQPANLLSERRRLGASVRNRIVLLAAGAPLFVLLNLVGWLAGSALLAADLGAQHAEIASIRQRIEEATAERTKLNAELAGLRTERSAREAIAARPVWAAMVRRIAGVTASHGRLERFTVRPMGADRTRQSAAAEPMVGFEIQLAGHANDATALTTLLLELESIGVFNQVSLISSARVREDTSDASIRFEIRCSISGADE